MPRPKVFTVGLSDVDREKLTKLISTGTHPARMIMRARVLLDLDENLGRVDDQAVIADRVGVAVNTVRAVAKRFVETDGDVEATIGRKQRNEARAEQNGADQQYYGYGHLRDDHYCAPPGGGQSQAY